MFIFLILLLVVLGVLLATVNLYRGLSALRRKSEALTRQYEVRQIVENKHRQARELLETAKWWHDTMGDSSAALLFLAESEKMSYQASEIVKNILEESSKSSSGYPYGDGNQSPTCCV